MRVMPEQRSVDGSISGEKEEMKMSGQHRPIKWFLTINLSHSADARLRKSEVTCVGFVGPSQQLYPAPTHMVTCSVMRLVGSTAWKGLAR